MQTDSYDEPRVLYRIGALPPGLFRGAITCRKGHSGQYLDWPEHRLEQALGPQVRATVASDHLDQPLPLRRVSVGAQKRLQLQPPAPSTRRGIWNMFNK